MKIINFYDGVNKVYSVYAEDISDVKNNPQGYYDKYSQDLIISDVEFINPILEKGKLREMTREEQLKAGKNINLEDGEVIKGNHIIKLEKPSQYHKWNGKEWTVNLDEIKNTKREELKVIRINKLYENITVNGDTFQMREQDLENFWEADYMLGNGEVQENDTRNWILADNSIKIFTYLQILNVLTEFIKRKAKIFDKFGELSIKLSSAKTVEEIEAIRWE